jgi:hypothetical protein
MYSHQLGQKNTVVPYWQRIAVVPYWQKIGVVPYWQKIAVVLIGKISSSS